jgi:hypothetical protein
MTDRLYTVFARSKERICKHTIAGIFQNCRETRETEPLVGPVEIRAAVKNRRYVTLEDWFRAIRPLKDPCTVRLAFRAASDVKRFVKREYRQLLSLTSSEA